VEWDANLRSDIATSLEEFIADPETDSKTFGMVRRRTVYELGIGHEWITFRKHEAQNLLSDLRDVC